MTNARRRKISALRKDLVAMAVVGQDGENERDNRELSDAFAWRDHGGTMESVGNASRFSIDFKTLILRLGIGIGYLQARCVS
jgi:hypothetical protein